MKGLRAGGGGMEGEAARRLRGDREGVGRQGGGEEGGERVEVRE